MLRACAGAAATGCWAAVRRTERASKDIEEDEEDSDENGFELLTLGQPRTHTEIFTRVYFRKYVLMLR